MSKANILKRLRAAQTPFTDVQPVTERKRMTPISDVSPAGLKARFIAEAQWVACHVWPCADDEAAIAQILALVGEDRSVMAWDAAHLNLPGLAEALSGRGIAVSGPRDSLARVGITGVDAALAATGSLIVTSGEGRARGVSLLPSVHVAVVRENQIIPDLEAFFEARRAQGLDAFRSNANTVVITGSSRTADIGQELIHGAHGPVEVHVVLIE